MDKTFTASEVRELAEWLSGVSVMGTGKTCHMLHAYADRLEADEKTQAQRGVWVLVPREPTEGMLKAAEDAVDAASNCESTTGDLSAIAYKAALAAAPQSQAAEPVASVGRYPGGGPRLDLLVPPDRAPPEGALLYARAATPHVERMTEALRNLCAEMASVAKERGVSRDQVNTYRWCKRRIMAIVADHLTKTHPQPAQDAKDASRYRVREAYATLDAEVSPPGRVSYEAYRAWCTICAELLRLAGECAMIPRAQLLGNLADANERAEKAGAELVALEARMFQGIVLDVDDLARGHAGLPSEWCGKRVLLVVEE